MFEYPITFQHDGSSTSAGRIDCYRRGTIVLAASPAPLSVSALEARFKGPWPMEEGPVHAAANPEALGRAHAIQTLGGVAWRG